MAEFDYKEYARQMRENCIKDYNGNIIRSAVLWERKIILFHAHQKKEVGRSGENL